jgi:hypothetical protein
MGFGPIPSHFLMRWVLGCLSPQIKRSELENGHSPPTILEFKNACSRTYTSKYIAVMLCAVKDEQLLLWPFGIRPVIVGFVVDRLARRQVFIPQYFDFPPVSFITQALQTHLRVTDAVQYYQLTMIRSSAPDDGRKHCPKHV